MKPLVSVIIPCYNVQAYVNDCVDSVLANSYENLEIILVDDGSTDDTARLIAPYAADPRVAITTKPNGGISSARNAGLDVAQGAYILFIDSDDWVAPGYVEAAVEVIEREPCDLLVIDRMLAIYNLDGSVLQTPQGVKMPVCSTHQQVMSEAFAGLIGLSKEDIANWGETGSIDKLRVHGYVTAKMYRRDVIEKHHLRFDESVFFMEDVYFNLHYLLYSKKTAILDDPLYFYRIRKDGSNSVARANVSPARCYSEKVQGVQLRSDLRDKAFGIDGVDIRPMYCGSIALSAIEVALWCARDSRALGLKGFLAYFTPEVRACIGLLAPGGNLKFDIPLVLMKAHLEPLVYCAVRLLVLLKMDARVAASGIKNS